MISLAPTPISGVYEAVSAPVGDHRGRFARLFCSDALSAAHANRPIRQINHSVTQAVGAVRGLHYQQAPHSEAKWVRCLKGRVFDVAVDLRAGSPTFLAWHGVELDAGRMNALFIPEGCAHGFQVLSPASELLYLHTAAYVPAAEGGVRFDDPAIGISWPLAVDVGLLSARDRDHAFLPQDFTGVAV